MIPARQQSMAGGLLRKPFYEAVHRLLGLAKKTPVPAMDQQITGWDRQLRLQTVRIRYCADDHLERTGIRSQQGRAG